MLNFKARTVTISDLLLQLFLMVLEKVINSGIKKSDIVFLFLLVVIIYRIIFVFLLLLLVVIRYIIVFIFLPLVYILLLLLLLMVSYKVLYPNALDWIHV